MANLSDPPPPDSDVPPTLKTIAAATGLAIATVSRALKDVPDIGEETKRRVRETAALLGYRPNRAGVRLRTGKTNVIALVLSTEADIMNHTSRLIYSIANALRGTSYHLVVTPFFPDQDPMDPIRYIVETESADGIILNQTKEDDPRIRYMHDHGFPFAAHGRTSMGIDHPFFDFDNEAYGRLGARVMAERGRIKTSAGRATFSILLAQDLVVAPILITVTVLAALAQSGVGGGDFDPAVLRPALFTLIPAAIGLALLVVLGRLVLRPMFRSVARAKAKGQGQEMFIAASLLVVVGAGVAAQAAGLSMSLGALIAGLLLAETEFRREVEISIEPFKGLLLGVFFVGVGISLDLDAVAADPVAVFGLAVMLTLLKAVLIFGAARLWGLNNRTAIETALVLGPAGEFAFVILGAGLVEGIASPAFTRTVLMAATISVFTVPLRAVNAHRPAAGPMEAADDFVGMIKRRQGAPAGCLLQWRPRWFSIISSTASALRRAVSRSSAWCISVKRCTSACRALPSVSCFHRASAIASGVAACCSNSGTRNSRARILGKPTQGW